MEIKNYILGEFKESYSNKRGFVRDINGKKTSISFPKSEEGDLADAFMAAKHSQQKIADTPIKEIIAKIKNIGKRYIRDEKVIQIIAESTGSPVSYINNMVESLRKWMLHIDEYINFLFGSVKNLEDGMPKSLNGKIVAKRVFQPRGITSIILAGDEVGLAAFVLIQALLSRNPIILKPSVLELLSTYELVKEFHKEGLDDFIQMVCWSSSDNPNLVKHLIKNCDQIVLFGSDSTVNALIYERDENGNIIEDYSRKVNVIAHTTGRSASIVLKDADIDDAVKKVIIGATVNRGNECIHSKKVFGEEVF